MYRVQSGSGFAVDDAAARRRKRGETQSSGSSGAFLLFFFDGIFQHEPPRPRGIVSALLARLYVCRPLFIFPSIFSPLSVSLLRWKI